MHNQTLSYKQCLKVVEVLCLIKHQILVYQELAQENKLKKQLKC